MCNVIGGGTPAKDNSAFYDGDIPWATVRDMRSEILSSTEFRITKEAVQKSATNIIPANNVVIATRVGLGKVCMLAQDTAVNQDLRGVVPKTSDLDSMFLFRWFQSVADQIVNEGTGATVQGVKLPFIKSLQIPIPSKSEQKRIVALLDEAFTGLDAAIANTTKNLANARELFDSYLNTIFTNAGDGWLLKAVEDIADVKGGKRVPKGYKLLSELTSHPYITVSDFNERGSVDVEGLKYISNEVYQQIKRYTISPTDLYISIAGTIGRAGIIPSSLAGANLTENACKLVFKEGISNKFMYYFTKTWSFREQAIKHTRTAAQPKLALERLKTIKVSIPPYHEQIRLVEEFDSLMDEILKLEVIYKQKLNSLAELKQSLLQKAFTGQLTTKAMSEDAAA